MLCCVCNLISWTFVLSAPMTLLIFKRSIHAIARQLDRVSFVIANLRLYTVSIIVLFDQSYVILGHKPKRLRLVYNVHVCIVIFWNEVVT